MRRSDDDTTRDEKKRKTEENILREALGSFIEKEMGLKPKLNEARKLGEVVCFVELHG